MNIRELAERDLSITLEDTELGFAFECNITNPVSVTETFAVQSGDIHLLLDTENDGHVNNRVAHISMRISSLAEKNFDIPRVEPDETKNPWIFVFEDIAGVSRKFTVLESQPDRTLGIVTILLELVKN